jgi:hypothetical protein
MGRSLQAQAKECLTAFPWEAANLEVFRQVA